MKSSIKLLGTVQFPVNTGERIYMREFRKGDGLPADLIRWQPTVDAMLEQVDTDGPIFLMVDQSLVRAGTAQRRPGLHIDGYWDNGVRAHGPVQPGHVFAGAHRPEAFEPKHRALPGQKKQVPGGRHGTTPKHGGWDAADFTYPEDILLASDVRASRVLLGEWAGQIGAGGDCSHICTDALESQALEANRVYAGNVTLLHESMPVPVDCLRTLVRLNVPGWSHTV